MEREKGNTKTELSPRVPAGGKRNAQEDMDLVMKARHVRHGQQPPQSDVAEQMADLQSEYDRSAKVRL